MNRKRTKIFNLWKYLLPIFPIIIFLVFYENFNFWGLVFPYSEVTKKITDAIIYGASVSIITVLGLKFSEKCSLFLSCIRLEGEWKEYSTIKDDFFHRKFDFENPSAESTIRYIKDYMLEMVHRHPDKSKGERTWHGDMFLDMSTRIQGIINFKYQDCEEFGTISFFIKEENDFLYLYNIVNNEGLDKYLTSVPDERFGDMIARIQSFYGRNLLRKPK